MRTARQMDSDTAMRTVALGAVLAGGCLLLFGTYLWAYESQAYFSYHVSEADGPEIDDELPANGVTRSDVVFEYDDLSPNARAAFLDALEADDRVVVRGEKHRAPEFEYASDYTDLGYGTYFVAYEGAYYRVSTLGPGPLFGLGPYLVTCVSTAVGTGLALGGLRWIDRRTAMSVALAVPVAALAGLAVPRVESLAVTGFRPFLAVGWWLFLAAAVAIRSRYRRLATGVGTLFERHGR